VVLVAGLLLLIGGIAVAYSRSFAGPSMTPPAAADEAPLNAPQDPTVLVFVSGAVAHPGLYRLSPDARVADAIAAAGGMASDADPGRLPNLAAKIHDGRQINVPFLRGSAGASTSRVPKLDVNSATLDDLRQVAGMPAGLPEAIVAYRSRFGPFTSLTDLRQALALDSALATSLARSLVASSP
jgi:competence protein ComEA